MTQPSRVYVARWLSYERTEHGVLFQAQSDAGDPLQVEITTLEPAVMRLRMAPGQLGPPNDRLLVPTRGAVSGSILSADQDGLTLSSPQLRLRVSRDPWCLSLTNLDGDPIASQAIDDRNILGAFEVMPMGWEKDAGGAPVRVYDALSLAPDERFFGFGERFVPLDQRGRSWTSWAVDAVTTSTQRAYKPVPFGMSSRGYGLFINSTAAIDFDLGASSSLSFAFSPAATELDYFIIFGPALNDVLRRYWRLTGTPPLPPYWSFGFWTSRFGYENRAEVEAVAQGYRERGIPCDVIHLDPQWMGGAGELVQSDLGYRRFSRPQRDD